LYFIISALILLVGIVFLIMNKVQTGSALNYGIDFKGGGLVTYQLAADTHFQNDNQRSAVGKQIREALATEGIGNEVKMAPSTQSAGDQIIVTTMLGEGAKEKKGQELQDEILNTITPVVNEAVKQALPNAPVADVVANYTIPAISDRNVQATLIGDITKELTAKGITGSRVDIIARKDGGNLIVVQTALGQQFASRIDSEITPIVAAQVKTVIADAPAIQQADSVTPIVASMASYDVVSGTIKDDLVNGGIAALIVGSLLIMLWIWFRYNIGGLGLRYSIAGIIALAHDLLTLVGLFAILHHFLQVNSPFIAALLTVLGYSIHDTIIIFDRIRENIRLRKGRTFAETVNISLLETMARSVNTILTVLLTLLALFFFGGPTLRDFVAAMLIGVVVGGYSSIFVASQLLVAWAKGDQRIILPPDVLVPAMAGAAAAPRSVPAPRLATPAPSGAINTPVEPIEQVKTANTPSSEAIQRAKNAGKTSRRRR